MCMCSLFSRKFLSFWWCGPNTRFTISKTIIKWELQKAAFSARCVHQFPWPISAHIYTDYKFEMITWNCQKFINKKYHNKTNLANYNKIHSLTLKTLLNMIIRGIYQIFFSQCICFVSKFDLMVWLPEMKSSNSLNVIYRHLFMSINMQFGKF